MSEVRYELIPLTTMFTIGRGLPKYTRAYANQHKGIYPVFSSKTNGDGVFAHIDTFDFDGEYLTWSTDGYAGIPAYRKGKFSCTDHCGILILNEDFDDIYLPYVRWQVDFRQLRRGYNNQRVKVNQVKKSGIQIKVPVNEEGKFDYQKQQELAMKYYTVEEQKRLLLKKAQELEKISVIIPQDSNMEMRRFDEIFSSVTRGKSKYTKTFCRENSGEYAVHSADNEKPLGMINSYDFDGEYLTISINGIAGKISIFNGKFSVNADRVVCVPEKDIYIKYVKYIAEQILRGKIKGRVGNLGKNEFSKLTPDMIRKQMIPIPMKKNGNYDFELQKEVADKYEQIEQIKKNLIKKITELTNIVIV